MPTIRHLVARFEGLIGQNQTWSINPKFDFPTTSVPTQASMDAWATALLGLEGGDVLPLAAFKSSAVTVTGVSCYYVNDDGDAVVISKRSLTTPVAGIGDANMPPQASVVTSLQTNIAGRSGRGRLYWPLLGTNIDPDTLRIASGDVTTIAQAVATWIQDVADAYTGLTINPAVISTVQATAYPIVSVRVGDVIDTQRRRRDQLLENYVVAPLS